MRTDNVTWYLDQSGVTEKTTPAFDRAIDLFITFPATSHFCQVGRAVVNVDRLREVELLCLSPDKQRFMK